VKKVKAIITTLGVFVIVFPLFCICEVKSGYKALMPPLSTHILGLDQLGRDILSLLDVFMSVSRMFILLLLGVIIPSGTLFVASIIAILTVFPVLRVISSTLITLKGMPFMESTNAVGVFVLLYQLLSLSGQFLLVGQSMLMVVYLSLV